MDARVNPLFAAIEAPFGSYDSALLQLAGMKFVNHDVDLNMSKTYQDCIYRYDGGNMLQIRALYASIKIAAIKDTADAVLGDKDITIQFMNTMKQIYTDAATESDDIINAVKKNLRCLVFQSFYGHYLRSQGFLPEVTAGRGALATDV